MNTRERYCQVVTLKISISLYLSQAHIKTFKNTPLLSDRGIACAP